MLKTHLQCTSALNSRQLLLNVVLAYDSDMPNVQHEWLTCRLSYCSLVVCLFF